MRKFLPLILFSGVLLILKFSNLEIRISDTNIYFYTAYELLQGKLLYKDIFFTNFPLFPYLSSFYFLLVNGNLKFFFLTPTLEVIIASTLIYFIVLEKIKNNLVSLTSSLLYMFSFLLLSTSDHQTGVFLASIFSLLSYLFLQKKNYILSGIFIALTILAKAYFLPVLTSLFLISILKNKRGALRLTISFLATCFIILLPFILFVQNELITDVFKYSLTRLPGLSKIEIAWFFITHDFIFFLLLIYNLINIKKQLFWGSFSFFSIIFFIFYNDVYYLYLNFLAPFLALSFENFYTFTKQKFQLQPMVIPTFIIIFSVLNIIIYLSYYKDLQKIPNIDKLVDLIKTEKPKYLYGVNDITPALSYLSQTPLLNNIIDTNESIFKKNFLNAATLTSKAIHSKTILVAHGAFYPQVNAKEEILDGIFDQEKVKKSCKLISSFPVQSEGIINRINLLKCY